MDNDEVALQLIKNMLVRENELRLAPRAYDGIPDKDRDMKTVQIQTQVVQETLEYLKKGKGARLYFDSIETGLLFLRAAVGNFPSHTKELYDCAQYVAFTQHCRRGKLRVGDCLLEQEMSDISLIDVASGERTSFYEQAFENVSSYKNPLVVLASSSS